MGKITASAPVLLVKDVVASADYFKDKLGFTYERFWGDPPNFCMVTRDDHTVMLSQAGEASKLQPHWKIVSHMWNIYFWVDDVDAICEEVQERGAIIDYGLGMKDYGVKEFGVQDLDEHDIAFGQRMT